MHGRFINEKDFPAGGAEAYRNWVDLYITYMYEPIDEAYEETRYFTEDFEKSFSDKCKSNKAGKSSFLGSVRVKKPAPSDFSTRSQN